MKAVLCLFDTLFLSLSKTRKQGLYTMGDTIDKWIKKMKQLPVKSVEGFIYNTEFLSEDIQVIIKVPKETSGFQSLLREYFLGISIINKLRYRIPTFVYTLGAFICPEPNTSPNAKPVCKTNNQETLYVLYENIKGNSVKTLLSENRLTFDDWLKIFVQLLLSLEVAQEHTDFTHFDLHTGNVMVREGFNFNYTIPIGNTSYNIILPDLVPTIIDFGMSCAQFKYNKEGKEEQRYIGSYDFAQYGMLNFMVQGYDMYKFLIYSCIDAIPSMFKGISEIFRFYGNNDPYHIIETGMRGISNATDEYCKLASYSNVATYTPIMMVKWIWSNYREILEPTINVTSRITFLPIQYSSTIGEYEDIFKQTKLGRQKALALADECVNLRPSYIMTRYNVQVLEKYNETLQSPELKSRIKSINLYLSSTAKNLIEIDRVMLEKVFDIPIPSESEVVDERNHVLRCGILQRNPKMKENAVKRLENLLQYRNKLENYLQFYYTILELDLEKDFSDWIIKFVGSDIFKFHKNNMEENERALRWGKTLLASFHTWRRV
jgi:serine/threonine protein kinase